MNTKKEINKKIDNLDKDFKNLITNNELSINSIEELTLNGIGEVKQIIVNHIENLINKNVSEKELINKKKKNGTKKISN